MDANPPQAPVALELRLAALADADNVPVPAGSWSTPEGCFLAVELHDRAYAPLVTYAALLRSEDGGRTWQQIGDLEATFSGAYLTRGGDHFLWTTWVVEGTYSIVYRMDGDTPQPLLNLDEAVRERGGCCLTAVEELHFRSARRGLVRVSGLEPPEEDPAGPDEGWFGTVDGGESWRWLGEEPPRAWRRTLRQTSRTGPGCVTLPFALDPAL